MDAKDLSSICQMMTAIVEHWLSNEDELTYALHKAALETIDIAGFAPMGAFIINFGAENELFVEDFGRREIEDRADAFLRSEFYELSLLFSGLYDDFNRRYFDGWLPACHVKVIHSLPCPDYPTPEPMASEINFDRRDVAIQYDGKHEYMVSRLVTLMAYLRVGLDNDSALKQELKRLTRRGAPTPNEVQRLQKEIQQLRDEKRRNDKTMAIPISSGSAWEP